MKLKYYDVTFGKGHASITARSFADALRQAAKLPFIRRPANGTAKA